MATSTAPISAPVLSKKQRRAAQRKQRRKRKRQALAQARESGLEAGGSCISDEDINDEVDEDISIAEEERMRLHEQWLEKERIAQEEFRLRVEREEAARKRKEDEERMIKEEWEAQQQREQEEREHKLQEKRDKEEAVQKMLDEAENQLDNGPWMNPEAPMTKTQSSQNFGTERDVTNCPFFLKTGACRFGERCSRKHVYPATSPTLMIRGMFTTFGMEESRRDDYDIDACLEHTEEELQESFFEFYHDVLPEFKSVGKVVQFKVSCNYEPHLKGNVYIQFDTEEQCKEAFIKFNGRWYAGRQLQCELCPVTRWKNAICGLFDRQKCPKGKHCNFLHVFRNPGHEFWEADRDLHMSPDRSVRSSRRDGWHSERYGDRSWKHRNNSRSPPISERSHSRREDNRRRSRSRERRASYQDKEDKWVSRSRHRDKRTDRYLSSRDRVRSRSREREQDRLRHRSRDKDSKHRYRNRSEERDLDEDTFREMRERSRSTSTERKRNRLSRERSPSKIKKNSNGETNTHSCSKRSKKSKKKSKKKKRKKKSHLSNATSSSGESEKGESDEEGENLSANGPSERICESKPTLKNSDIDINVDTETLSPKPTTEIAVSLLETVT